MRTAIAFAVLVAWSCGGVAATHPELDAAAPDAFLDAAALDAADAGADADRNADANAQADAQPSPTCPGASYTVFPDGSPPWVTCSCPDAGCPSQTVCAFYIVPEGPWLPFGCAPLPSGCDGPSRCACAGGVCGVASCYDREAGVLCNY